MQTQTVLTNARIINTTKLTSVVSLRGGPTELPYRVLKKVVSNLPWTAAAVKSISFWSQLGFCCCADYSFFTEQSTGWSSKPSLKCLTSALGFWNASYNQCHLCYVTRNSLEIPVLKESIFNFYYPHEGFDQDNLLSEAKEKMVSPFTPPHFVLSHSSSRLISPSLSSSCTYIHFSRYTHRDFWLKHSFICRSSLQFFL